MNEMADDGQIFVCGACGKMSKDLFGEESSGWDESCMLNAILCWKDKIVIVGNRVQTIKDDGIVKKGDS